jgi:hypothetical protein
MDECPHHEAIEVEIVHLKNAFAEIRRMFVAILIGLVLTLAGLAGNYHTLQNGHATVAHAMEAMK